MTLRASALLSIPGLAGLFVAIGLGFEEANTTLFAASACLLPAAPLAVVLHAALTSRLTPARRRTWLRALLGPGAVSAMSRYLAHGTRRTRPRVAELRS
jgi:hypothetical protein